MPTVHATSYAPMKILVKKLGEPCGPKISYKSQKETCEEGKKGYCRHPILDIYSLNESYFIAFDGKTQFPH